ncbi:hypothetical protein GQ600_18054 [Phytophthora cactorum]|nr:hypothetical protein GQ600_18054 [Phytophthora cactorum]
MAKHYAKNPRVVVVTPDVFGWVVGTKITMDAEAVEATLTTELESVSSSRSAAIRIIANSLYLRLHATSYLSSVRVVAEKLTPMLATSTGKDFAYRRTNRTWESSWTTTAVACLSFLLLSTSQVHHRSGEWTRS